MGMAANNSIKVTYELIYEQLRKEQDRAEMQKLDPTFWSDVAVYLAEKQAQILSTMDKDDMFSAQERDKLMTQVRNARRVIKDLFDKRESKVIQLAVNKSRTNSPIIQELNLLEEEKQVYHSIVSIMTGFRAEALGTVLEGVSRRINNEAMPKIPDMPEKKPEPSFSPTQSMNSFEVASGVKLKFVQAVPKFVGKELEVYGPYEKEQVTDLPLEIANILINNGSAVKV